MDFPNGLNITVLLIYIFFYISIIAFSTSDSISATSESRSSSPINQLKLVQSKGSEDPEKDLYESNDKQHSNATTEEPVGSGNKTIEDRLISPIKQMGAWIADCEFWSKIPGIGNKVKSWLVNHPEEAGFLLLIVILVAFGSAVMVGISVIFCVIERYTIKKKRRQMFVIPQYIEMVPHNRYCNEYS